MTTTPTNPFDEKEETYALVTYKGEHGRTQNASVRVLDWTDEGWAMVAHPDGQLVPVYDIEGFVCLAGAGVVPYGLPTGGPGAGRARALFHRRARR